MQMVRAAIFDQETGQVTATMEGSADMLAAVQSWVEIPPGLDLVDPVSWSVDLETLELTVTDLAPIKAAAVARVNDLAGRARAPFITDIPGQEMLYSDKAQEARDVLAMLDAGGQPDPLDFPFLQMEVELRPDVPDLPAAAVFILGRARALRQVGAPLERLRLGASLQIEAASTAAEVEAAVSAAAQGVHALQAALAAAVE